MTLALQDPELLRRLLRAKDRLDAASHEEWPVRRLAEVSGVSEAHFARSVTGESPGTVREQARCRPRAGPGAGVLPRRRAPARPHDRSFGEAAPRGRRYKRDRRNEGDSMNGVQVVGLYVRDQDEAVDFYVRKVGFQVNGWKMVEARRA